MVKYFKFLIIFLVSAFIVPQIAFAAWWNPMSWGIWNSVFHVQQAAQKQTQQQAQKLNTDSWKTYTNTRYGFEIKIPNYFVVKSEPEQLFFMSAKNQNDYEKSLNDCKSQAHPGACGEFELDGYSNLIFTTLFKDDKNTKLAAETINEITWQKFYPASLDIGEFYRYSTSMNKKDYDFYSTDNSFIQQVLSTFKFIK